MAQQERAVELIKEVSSFVGKVRLVPMETAFLGDDLNRVITMADFLKLNKDNQILIGQLINRLLD